MSAEQYFAAIALAKMCLMQETLELMCAYYSDVLTAEKPYERYEKFDVDMFTDEQCRVLFRFDCDHLMELTELLCMPEYTAHNSLQWTPLEGTALLWRRLSCPGRLEDLAPHFGRPKSQCSLIFNSMLADIHHCFSRNVDNLHQPWFDPEKYAAAVHCKGAPVSNVWGFIDGTLCHACRPTDNQREMFSGHKRRHGVKFQHVMCPDGIVVHAFGPYPGSQHDAAMYGVSQLDASLQTVHDSAGAQMAIYGDAAYPLRPWLLTPYQGNLLNPQQKFFNSSMNPLRTCVEWGFAKLFMHFSFLNYSTTQISRSNCNPLVTT